MRRWLATALLLGSPLLLSPPAQASSLEIELRDVRQWIQDGEWERARKQLEARLGDMEQAEYLYLDSQLARVSYYLGLLDYYEGASASSYMNHWRQCLLHQIDFKWDDELSQEEDLSNRFSAIQSEILSRPQLPSGLPETLPPAFLAYVDGNVLHDFDLIRSGGHLLQVTCPDGTLQSRWVEFELYEPAPDYLSLCPGLEDWQPPVTEPEPKDLWSQLQGGSVSTRRAGLSLLGLGVALDVLVTYPQYREMLQLSEDRAALDPLELELLERSYNLRRGATLTLLGAGLATTAASWWIPVQEEELVLPLWSGSF